MQDGFLQEATPLQDLHETPLQNLSGGKYNSYFSSSKYLGQKASAKMNDLWAEISATAGKTSSFPYKITLGGIMAESMNPTFT